MVDSPLVSTLAPPPANKLTGGCGAHGCHPFDRSSGYEPRLHRSARGLKPHLVETFKVSNDPLFEAKLIDVVGLYLDPPDNAVVLCMDEKSSVQAYPG